MSPCSVYRCCSFIDSRAPEFLFRTSRRCYSPRVVRTHEEVGITSFILPHEIAPGFPARLKDFKRDFQVREIPLGDSKPLTLSGPLWLKKHASELPSPPEQSELQSTREEKPDAWPDRPDHLHFRLYQEGIGTQEALAMIARCVGRPAWQFRSAGTKDRRALSAQIVSVYRLTRTKLRRAVLHPQWDSRVRFSDLEYRHASIRIGDLEGNHFKLALRGVPANMFSDKGRQDLQQTVECLSKSGFLNYFGLQRFGSQKIASHRIGAALLSSNWDQALELILGDAAEELLPLAKDVASNSKSIPKELQKLPQRHHLERDILVAIAQGLSAEAALRKLPWSVLFMYVNAAQSLVWNHVLSKRIAVYGIQPVEGDLAAPSKAAQAAGAAEASVDGVFGLAWGALGAQSLTSSQAAELESVQSGFGLMDTVLPLPGRSVRYPKHLQQYYEDVSQELLGLPLKAFHGTGGITPPEGAYRKVAMRAEDLQCECLSAEEVQQKGQRLLLSDVDLIYQANAVGKEDQRMTIETSESSEKEAAVLLSFSLKPAAYATMVVRELTRDLAKIRQADGAQFAAG